MITQKQVTAQLDNARENGYFLDLALHPVPTIVADMQECSEECEGVSDEVLTPLVQTWYDARLIGDSQAGKAVDC